MATAINAFSNAASMLSLYGIPYAISVRSMLFVQVQLGQL
jgi:hypothetical protein